MNSIISILIIITIVTTWEDYIRHPKKLNFKPFNCTFCLSFWLSVITFFITFEPLVLTTCLFLRIIERRLL